LAFAFTNPILVQVYFVELFFTLSPIHPLQVLSIRHLCDEERDEQ
jgi:hypothetical protein